jgi:hypothetical protein
MTVTVTGAGPGSGPGRRGRGDIMFDTKKIPLYQDDMKVLRLLSILQWHIVSRGEITVSRRLLGANRRH